MRNEEMRPKFWPEIPQNAEQFYHMQMLKDMQFHEKKWKHLEMRQKTIFREKIKEADLLISLLFYYQHKGNQHSGSFKLQASPKHSCNRIVLLLYTYTSL